MGKKDKKKGKGAEKAQAKALKKASKTEKSAGMDELEALISSFKEEDRKANTVDESPLEAPPSPRSHSSFVAHCEKDLLILFGGEYFDGQVTHMYNDLIIYNIKKDCWTKLFVPHGPTPRSSQASAMAPQGGGQLWLHGGEFSSKNGENFHHFKDLWCLTVDGKNSKWEEIKSKGSPSARSGHRMVYYQKQLIVFGGFHERIKDYVYFNDLYSFDIVSRQWSSLKPTGVGPSARSGVQMGSCDKGVVIIGGYSKLKAKKDSDRGNIHSDGFILQFEISKKSWKWEKAKQGGDRPTPRSSTAMTQINEHRLVSFGGTQDEDDDDDMQSEFLDEMNFYDTKTSRWFPAVVKAKDDDGKDTRPGPRMNTQMTVRSNVLYLYGGILEQGERSYTLNDLWALDLKKMEKWKQIVETEQMDWAGSNQGSDTESENESEEEEEESDSEPEEKPAKKKRPNHPDPFHAEIEGEYLQRTKTYWIDLLRRSMEDNEDTEELTNDEVISQSQTLGQKWFKKCSKARMGMSE